MLDLEQIVLLSRGIDEHLRKLESFTSLLKDIKLSIDQLKETQEKTCLYELNLIKEDVGDLVEQLRKRGLPHADRYEKQLQEIRNRLKATDWPLAVPPDCICDNQEKAYQRAGYILDLIVGEHLKDKRFLDYGCGEGHAIPKAKEREASLALGYDLNLANIKLPLDDFVSTFNDVRKQGPFDVILIHDVLDHIMAIDPISALREARSVLAPNGRIYVKNHPWSARHAGHLYLDVNKAFIHLVLDEIEVTRIYGLQLEHSLRVVTPLETYRHWFEQAGLIIINEIPIKNEVEHFFLTPSETHDRIKKHFDNPDTMVNNLEISFVEYVLEPARSHQQIF